MEILKRLYIVILVLRLLYALDRGNNKYQNIRKPDCVDNQDKY